MTYKQAQKKLGYTHREFWELLRISESSHFRYLRRDYDMEVADILPAVIAHINTLLLGVK